jgi:hypothetical protein
MSSWEETGQPGADSRYCMEWSSTIRVQLYILNYTSLGSEDQAEYAFCPSRLAMCPKRLPFAWC